MKSLWETPEIAHWQLSAGLNKRSACHDPGLRNVMKIVQNPNRWLKKLSRAAALISLAMGTQAAYSQDGPFSFGRTPTGSVSEVVDSNRAGFGTSFRAGHIAGDTVGRDQSISHIGAMPYVNIDNSLIFGDARLVRANEGGLAWSFGSGMRYYIEDWDVVLGGNGYFDRDELTGAHLKQWSAGAELLAHRWEARGNLYQTFGNTFDLVGQNVQAGSAAFVGNNITYTRVDTFAEGLKGFDAEAGFLLPGELAETIDLRAFGGGYFYEGENIDGFSGWSTRLQADVARWLELGIKVTDDERFHTTVSFSAAVYFGGFKSEEHTKRSAIQRFRDPVRRNMNIVTLQSDVSAPGQVAINPDTNLPFTVAHVNSNDLVGPFNGTVIEPYQSLQTGLGAGTDIVFVHAGSQFTAGPENQVVLNAGQKLYGEGLIVPGRDVINRVTVEALGTNFLIDLPDSPTFAANPSLSRPILANTAGDAVTLASNSTFSGFTINNPTGNGIFGNAAQNVSINDIAINGAGNSAIFLQNTLGTTSISNATITSGAAATDALVHINGGSGTISFNSSDKFLLGSITNTSAQESLLIENMTGGRFSMSQASVTDTGGLGVVIQNNTGGAATVDNLTVTNGIGTGISILNSAGTYTFTKSSTQLQSIALTGTAQQGILISGLTGSAQFNAEVDINDRLAGGIEVTGSSGTVTFSDDVTLLNHLGAGNEAAVFVHNNLAGNAVEFSQNLNITSSVVTAGAAQRTNGRGIDISSNALNSVFRTVSTTLVNGTDGESIFIGNNAGTVNFGGVTQVTNRLIEGISIVNSSGGISFGVAPSRTTLISNALDSQFAAIEAIGNSGSIGFGDATVQNAQGNIGGGAGVHLSNNTGIISFADMDIESIDGTGFFGLNNTEIRSDDGIVDSTNETAVDIENSGIRMTLSEVDSANAPDYGIRLVDTNKDGAKTFTVRPTVANATPGTGGTISAAKGNGIDDNDAAGIFLQNAGQVTTTFMNLDNNEFGVRIINTETPGAVVSNNNEQFFSLQDSNVTDSDIRGIHSQDLMGLSVIRTNFDNNGDDTAVGRESIKLLYTLALDNIDNVDEYDRSDRPFEVLIQDSDFVSNTNDVIRIMQPVVAAEGAAIRVQFIDNTIQVNDTTDPTTVDADDTRPNFDDAFVMDWNGPARIFFDGNALDMRGIEQAVAFSLSNASNEDLTELSIQDNTIILNELGTDPGAINIDLNGDYDIGSNDGTFGIARNTMRISGTTPTAMFLSLRPTNNPQVQNLVFTANNIRLETDGGTGIEVRRSGNGAAVGFNRNRVEYRDLGAADERGFIFTQVTGTVNLFGTLNTMAVISNGQNGNNFIEVPFFIPANASNGSVEINGVIFP